VPKNKERLKCSEESKELLLWHCLVGESPPNSALFIFTVVMIQNKISCLECIYWKENLGIALKTVGEKDVYIGFGHR